MKSHFVILIISLVFIGCFNEQPKIPQLHVPQHVEITGDSVICAALHEDYAIRTFSCTLPYDSVQWYNDCSTGSYLGNADTLVYPNSTGCLHLRCLVFNAGDTSIITQELVYCTRYMFFPTGFSALDDGLNDTWYPI